MRRFLTAFLALSVALLAACGGQSTTPSGTESPKGGTDGTPAAEQPKELTKLSIRLDWSPNAMHAPLYVALDQGFYAAEGLDVTINPATSSDDVLKLVDTGIDTLGLYYQSSVLKSPFRGYNVRVVSAYVQHPLNVVVVDKRAGIQTLKDLEGKTVGFTDDPMPKGNLSTTAASLKMMVEKAGGDFSKITLENVGESGVQLLGAQKIDALGGIYEYHERHLLDKVGIETEVYRLHEHGAPDFYELVIVASEQAATEQADAIAKFIAATAKGVEFTKANQSQAAEILMKAEPTLKKDLLETGIPVLLPLWAGEKPFGHLDEQRFEDGAKWMLENKLLNELPDFNTLIWKR